MNIYDTIMKPLEKNVLTGIREKLIPTASGDVLELGYGTGVNFQYYNPASIRSLYALDKRLRSVAKTRARFPIRFVEGQAEQLSFPDECFDTVVETLVFCSVQDLHASIQEVLRVLKPGGIFIYIDHEKPPERNLSILFRAVNIFWSKMPGGCSLIREPDKLVQAAGFLIVESATSCHDIFHWGIGRKNMIKEK